MYKNVLNIGNNVLNIENRRLYLLFYALVYGLIIFIQMENENFN